MIIPVSHASISPILSRKIAVILFRDASISTYDLTVGTEPSCKPGTVCIADRYWKINSKPRLSALKWRSTTDRERQISHWRPWQKRAYLTSGSAVQVQLCKSDSLFNASRKSAGRSKTVIALLKHLMGDLTADSTGQLKIKMLFSSAFNYINALQSKYSEN